MSAEDETALSTGTKIASNMTWYIKDYTKSGRIHGTEHRGFHTANVITNVNFIYPTQSHPSL